MDALGRQGLGPGRKTRWPSSIWPTGAKTSSRSAMPTTKPSHANATCATTHASSTLRKMLLKQRYRDSGALIGAEPSNHTVFDRPKEIANEGKGSPVRQRNAVATPRRLSHLERVLALRSLDCSCRIRRSVERRPTGCCSSSEPSPSRSCSYPTLSANPFRANAIRLV